MTYSVTSSTMLLMLVDGDTGMSMTFVLYARLKWLIKCWTSCSVCIVRAAPSAKGISLRSVCTLDFAFEGGGLS